MSNGSSNHEPLIRAREKTVDVQQHFNDLSLRVRAFAITVITAVLGGAALAFKEVPHLAPWILGAGVIAWLGFFVMDALWYHRLLLGAVAHGEEVEDKLAAASVAGFGLTHGIRAKSAVKIGKLTFRSVGRLNLFYLGGLLLFGMLGLAAWWTEKPGIETPPAAMKASVLSERPALLFPPEGAVLKPGEAVAFGWELVKDVKRYHLQVQTENGEDILSIMVPRMRGTFVVGADVLAPRGRMRWRSVPTNALGAPIREVGWITFEVGP